MNEPNPIREAMRIIGGPDGRPEDLAVICRVSAQTVRNWLERGYLDNARDAVLIARATTKRGHPISIERLAGLGSTAPPRKLGRKGSGSSCPADRAGHTAAALPAGTQARLVGTKRA